MKRLSFLAAMSIVYPLSLLPLSILFVLSGLAYYIVYYAIRYRRKVVFANLQNSFPDRTDAEITSIAKKFYRNLCDIAVENIKLVSISKEEAERRCRIKNPEVLDSLFKQGRSVIATIGHCGNWELAGLATSLMAKHHSVTFYKRLKNIYFDRFAIKMRARFGMDLVPHTRARQMLKHEGDRPNMYIFITDQTPSNDFTSYWTVFLNQDTAIYKGAEKFAKLTGHPVVYGDIQRVKRGYYTIDVKMLAENSIRTKEGEITELHTRALEEAVLRHPDNWLWTHRRWKRKNPFVTYPA